MTTGTIVTFYSFKGGVGRSMAVANTAVALAANNARVCIVDWDLEAPGIDLYFQRFQQAEPKAAGGLLGILETKAVNWQDFAYKANVLGREITVLASGRTKSSTDYTKQLQSLDWSEFYKNGGGGYLEELTEKWREEFDFILLDSRTGLTDSGGVCTIQLPDILVLVFTANQQSLYGAKDIAEWARKHRQRLPYTKLDLTIIPLIGRWDGGEEPTEAAIWLKHIEEAVGEYFGRWSSANVSRQVILEELRVPHVAHFSFGEKLPVVTHSVTDQFLPGRSFVRLAALLSEMDWEKSESCAQQIAERITTAQQVSQNPQGSMRLYISAVSSEFVAYRQLLATELKRRNLEVFVQEDFIASGGSTLQKLDDYIKNSDCVIHLIGKAAGVGPDAAAVKALLAQYPDFANRLSPLAEALLKPDPGFSYAQWETYLASYHGRRLVVYRSAEYESAEHRPRDPRMVQTADQLKSQAAHCRRIAELGYSYGQFLNPERLCSAVLRELADILPALELRIEVPPTRLRHTAEQLLGREADLSMLDEAWNDRKKNVVVVRGKGGEGKTSLVASWMTELALRDWRGAERVFDWSFYSQGTGEQGATSADLFLHTALTAWGDPDPTLGSPAERGARLARLVGAQRSLLVLDGLERLQYPPGALHGQLKHPGLAALLRGLASHNAGLCVITTRLQVPEIRQFYSKTAVDHSLANLSPLAGAALLYNAGAQRVGFVKIQPDDAELQQASVEVQGHALTLNLMGHYLRLTENGDIRRRDRMKLAEADAEYKSNPQDVYGHAYKSIEAYEKWLAAGDEEAHRQLAVLRLLGLFDRPASAELLKVLRETPIAGLNDAFVGASEKEWRKALTRLQEINLIDVSEAGSVDCHPLIREYFGNQLKHHQRDAFRAAHSLLFNYICASTPQRPADLVGLKPLYSAIVHGCLAGRQEQALEVYIDRVQRGKGGGGYSMDHLGAIGADLEALVAFFDEPWSRPSANLKKDSHAWLLNDAAVRLRALGRLAEALEPMRAASQMRKAATLFEGAAISFGNLSQLEVKLGQLHDAAADADRAIDAADRSIEPNYKVHTRTIAGDALHQAGKLAEATRLFEEAERKQANQQPQLPQLYGLAGFRHIDLLIAPTETAAWKGWLDQKKSNRHPSIQKRAFVLCDKAMQRATQTLDWAHRHHFSLLCIALDHLNIARAKLYQALLSERRPDGRALQSELSSVVARFRQTNMLDELPRALLTAAFFAGTLDNSHDEARHYLDQAEQIAERGPMPLYLADVYLHRARLFRDKLELAKARALIEKHGYWRRKDELEDAEALI